jgi:L-seryl-tRNA(Ser) seleniumtransferase
MSAADPSDRWRALPSVRALVEDKALAEARARHSHEAIAEAARMVLARARDRIAHGLKAEVGSAEVLAQLREVSKPRLREVINATGVILHTNLGRAPLAAEAIAAATSAAGYTNLELHLESGERGGRDDGVAAHLHALVGAERAFAVNNCAAATLLALTAVASGKEVIVSRGELVEIGGGFRVPEVLQQSGCKLVEVGTTNKTRASDYERAITPETAAILRVHRSNFEIVGFTEEVPLGELAALAHQHSVPLLFDQGTGELPIVTEALKSGCDLITFSGDKLLGGPQAGLLAGRAALIEQARKHPLARALRIDKLTLAALEATLGLWRSGQASAIPAARMLEESVTNVRRRAEELGLLLTEPVMWEVVQTSGAAGGGTRAGQPMESYALAVKVDRPQSMARLLRTGDIPVVGRVADGRLLLDLRTVSSEQVRPLAKMIESAVARLGSEDGRT